LALIDPGYHANQNVHVGRDLHLLPAQPSAANSLISSIDKEGPFSFFRKLKTSEICPFGRAAFISIRPSGSFSTLIFLAGPHVTMFEDMLAQSDLPLGGDFEGGHGAASD
jgi:hypothetical protein